MNPNIFERATKSFATSLRVTTIAALLAACSDSSESTLSPKRPSLAPELARGFDEILSDLKKKRSDISHSPTPLTDRTRRIKDIDQAIQKLGLTRDQVAASQTASDTFALVAVFSEASVGTNSVALSTTTITNRTGVRYFHDAEWSVFMLGGPTVNSNRTHDEFYARDAMYRKTSWPLVTIPSKCPIGATINSKHSAVYPGDYLTPNFVSKRVEGASFAADQRNTPCGEGGPPSGTCEEESYCPPGSPSSSSSTGIGGGGSERKATVAFSGGPNIKTVCLVTDWYVNGVYQDTTVDACWIEPA